jgi:polysaccharide deacetylase family protein (PEP-CTERM system associated)
MNILTFDIEEWYIEKKYFGDRSNKYQEYDRYLKSILEVLDSKSIKATFMCVGELARLFPDVVKTIAERGHEIGCHSNEHVWLTTLNPDQLRKDTKVAITALEDVSGRKVRSYRAPAFSIGENNKYTLEILAENGIEMDSSIFPVARDFGGFSSFKSEEPSIIKYNGIELKEFPICTTKMMGKSLAYSGGGYFRLFPLSFVKRRMKDSNYVIFYFHIGDVVRLLDTFVSKELYENYFKEKGTLSNRLKRQIKSNLGISTTFNKMCRLIQENEFICLEKAEKMIEWNKAKIVEI